MLGVFEIIRALFDWPRKKCREIQLNLLHMTPYKKWDVAWKIGKVTTNIIGIHVLDDCKWNWLTPLGILVGIEQSSLTAYTMWYYWNENMITALQPLSILAIVVPVDKWCILNE